jgi:hypothetical protein
MRVQTLAGVAAISLLLASCQTASTDPNERPATKTEIESRAIGHTINGKLRYDANGRYFYGGGNPGKYTISDGKICIAFDNGDSRCDRITTDGSKYKLINAQGQRYPWG